MRVGYWMTYIDRCREIITEMETEGWPRLMSPVEQGGYSEMYRHELCKRLRGAFGMPPPDLRGTAYDVAQGGLFKRLGMTWDNLGYAK